MRALDQQIIEELKRRIPAEVLRHVRKFILYGSRVRGDAADDSDLDLAVLVDEKTPELEFALDEIAYSVMWDRDFKPMISLKIFTESRFRSAADKGFSFYRNVMREGIAI